MSGLLNVLLKETKDISRDSMTVSRGDLRRVLIALDAERAERERLEERVAKLEAGEVKVGEPAAKVAAEPTLFKCGCRYVTNDLTCHIHGFAGRESPPAPAVYDPATCRAIAKYLSDRGNSFAAGAALWLSGTPLPSDRP